MASPDETLAALRSSSLALLFSTQHYPLGFPSLPQTLASPDHTSLSSFLSEKELSLLTLWDKLNALALERRVLEAQASQIAGGEEEGDGEMGEWELEARLAEARGNRRLKEAVVEATVVAKPILGAVHGMGDDERGLLPMIQRRDSLTLTHANIANLLLQTKKELTKVEREYVEVRERNRGLAERLVELEKKREEEEKGGRGKEWEEAEDKWKVTRGRWEVVRGVAQGIVVASGVDWARDEDLRELVIECGDE